MLCAISLAAAGCGDSELAVDGGTGDGGDMPDAMTCLDRATVPLAIEAGAFPPSPSYPNVIVYVPQGFEATAPIDLVVHVHGFDNCITNVLGDSNEPCSPGGAVRNAYHLASQLEASARNALLVLPEVAFDEASGDPGRLGTTNGFRALLDETLASLPAPLGPLGLSSIGKVIVSVHSGGYRAVAAMITIGGVHVDEVWLFDALYGNTLSYDQWVMLDLASFTTRVRRFADVYTDTGGTETNSQAMANRVAMWVDPSVLVDDRTTTTWPDTTYAHGLLFKRSALSHDDVPRYYFEHMLATSQLAARPCP